MVGVFVERTLWKHMTQTLDLKDFRSNTNKLKTHEIFDACSPLNQKTLAPTTLASKLNQNI
jgi:hypothetical protein